MKSEFPHPILEGWLRIQQSVEEFMQEVGVPKEERGRLLDWGQDLWMESVRPIEEAVAEADFSFLDKEHENLEELINQELEGFMGQITTPYRDALFRMFMSALLTRAKLNRCREQLRETEQ
jgi:hypothetical protein